MEATVVTSLEGLSRRRKAARWLRMSAEEKTEYISEYTQAHGLSSETKGGIEVTLEATYAEPELTMNFEAKTVDPSNSILSVWYAIGNGDDGETLSCSLVGTSNEAGVSDQVGGSGFYTALDPDRLRNVVIVQLTVVPQQGNSETFTKRVTIR